MKGTRLPLGQNDLVNKERSPLFLRDVIHNQHLGEGVQEYILVDPECTNWHYFAVNTEGWTMHDDLFEVVNDLLSHTGGRPREIWYVPLPLSQAKEYKISNHRPEVLGITLVYAERSREKTTTLVRPQRGSEDEAG